MVSIGHLLNSGWTKKAAARCGPPRISYVLAGGLISPDQFIGLKEEFRWNRDGELLGGLKIDDQYKLGQSLTTVSGLEL